MPKVLSRWVGFVLCCVVSLSQANDQKRIEVSMDVNGTRGSGILAFRDDGTVRITGKYSIADVTVFVIDPSFVRKAKKMAGGLSGSDGSLFVLNENEAESGVYSLHLKKDFDGPLKHDLHTAAVTGSTWDSLLANVASRDLQAFKDYRRVLSDAAKKNRKAALGYFAKKALTFIPDRVRDARRFLVNRGPTIGTGSVLAALIGDALLGTNTTEHAVDLVRQGVESGQNALGLESIETGRFVAGAAGILGATALAAKKTKEVFLDRAGDFGFSLWRPFAELSREATRPLFISRRDARVNSLEGKSWLSRASDNVKRNTPFLSPQGIWSSWAGYRGLTYGVPAAFLAANDLFRGTNFIDGMTSLVNSGLGLVNDLTLQAPSLAHFLGETGLYAIPTYLAARTLSPFLRHSFENQPSALRRLDVDAIKKRVKALKRLAVVAGLGAVFAYSGLNSEGLIQKTGSALLDNVRAVDAYVAEKAQAGDDYFKGLVGGDGDWIISKDPRDDSEVEARIRKAINQDYGSLDQFYQNFKGGVTEGATNLANLPVSCFNSAKSLLD